MGPIIQQKSREFSPPWINRMVTGKMIAFLIGVLFCLPQFCSGQNIDHLIWENRMHMQRMQDLQRMLAPSHFPIKRKESAELKALEKFFEMEITLGNDSVIQAFSVIEWSDSGYYTNVGKKDQKVKVFSWQTKAIRCVDDGATYVGFATDSCWLFKNVVGPINGYSPFPKTKTTIVAIQLGEGPIVAFTKANLLRFVRADSEAREKADGRDWKDALLFFNKKHRVKSNDD